MIIFQVLHHRFKRVKGDEKSMKGDNPFVTGEFLMGLMVGIITIILLSQHVSYINSIIIPVLYVTIIFYTLSLYVLYQFMSNTKILNKILELNVFGRTIGVMLTSFFETLIGMSFLMVGILTIDSIITIIGLSSMISSITINIFVFRWYAIIEFKKRGVDKQ